MGRGEQVGIVGVRPQVTDFGLARVIESNVEANREQPEREAFTPAEIRQRVEREV